MDVFQLLGTIAINNSQAVRSLNEASQAGEQAESRLGNAFKKIGGAAVAVGKAVGTAMVAGGVAVTGLVTKSVQSYADYEQLVGGVETLFGESAGKVIDYADMAYKTAGMSANEYMETVTGFSASLLQSLGGDTEAAAEKANMALIDMSDNANKMGSDLESIKNAYGGFAKQNYTMLDNLKLGYGGTQEEMKRLLADAQAISGVQYDISSYGDVVDAIHVIQENMGIAGTTAKEASSTISGSLGMVKASWGDLLTAMSGDGWDLGLFIDKFVDSAEIAITNLLPVISTALAGVVQLIDQVAPIIIEKIPEILNQLLPVVVGAATNLLTGLANAIPGAISVLMEALPALIEGLQTIVNALIEALPGVMQSLMSALPTLLPMLIDALVSMIVTLTTNLPQIIQPIIDNLPQIVMSIVTALINNLPMLIEGTVTLIVGLVNAIPQIVVPLIEMMPEIIKMLVMAIVDSAPLLVDSFVNIWNSINIAIDEVVNAIIELVGKLWDWCVEYVGPVLEQYKTIIQNAWNAVKTAISNAMNAVKTAITNAWNNVKDTTSNVWNGIKSGIQNTWNGIKSGVSNAINGVKSTVSSVWNSIKSTTSSVWNGIKSAIETPINKARDLVKSAIDKIKGFFDFDFKWPKMPMPHFGISPSGWKISDLLEGSIPKLSIDWYAKAMENPMVMNGPTVFGFNPMTNSFMAGGEAGSEVVSGTNTLMTMISQAVASQNGGVISYLQQLISMLADYLPGIIENMGRDIVTDDGTVIAYYAPKFDAEFGRMKAQKDRGR